MSGDVEEAGAVIEIEREGGIAIVIGMDTETGIETVTGIETEGDQGRGKDIEEEVEVAVLAGEVRRWRDGSRYHQCLERKASFRFMLFNVMMLCLYYYRERRQRDRSES